MSTVKRTALDFDLEKQIVLNMIISSEFCSKILPSTRSEYFRSKSMQLLISWVRDHFSKYKQAPGNHINEYYALEHDYLDPDVSAQLAGVLLHLESISDTEVHNIDVLCDRASEMYQKKHFELQLQKAQYHLLRGELEEVEKALDNRFIVPTEIALAERWDDPKFLKRVIQGMLSAEDPDDAYFRFDGRLGEFIGNIGRWLVAILAPAKRGKTIYMMEAVVTGIRRKMNVVFLSLEMPTDQLVGRCLAHITGQKPGLDTQEVLQPIFDCELNQCDGCDKDERRGISALVVRRGDEEVIPEYHERPDWVVCTECRGSSEFVPAVWYTPIIKEACDEHEYFEKVNAFMRLYGKYCRSIFHPSKSITVDSIDMELDRLEQSENFIADMLVLDYGDLVKPSKTSGVKRFDLDEIWEDLRALQQRRRILLITASQTNRGSATANFIRATDIAEDYSKIAKLDLGIGLCQTDLMKERGMINLNKIAYRHGEFVESHTCSVLQELGYMQSNIDSEFQHK